MSTISHNGLIFQKLYDEEYIFKMISSIAGQVNSYYSKIKDEEGHLDLVVVCVLKGAFMFYSDLVKLIEFPHRNEFIKVKSYAGLNSTGELKVETVINPETYMGKSVLIVEDMHDTGTTLKKMVDLFHTLKPKRIDIAVLVKRPDRPPQVDIKFCGLVCNDFIVGYGLDYDEFGRHYPSIYQKI